MAPRSVADQRAIATLLNGNNKLFLNSIEALEFVLRKWDFVATSMDVQRGMSMTRVTSLVRA